MQGRKIRNDHTPPLFSHSPLVLRTHGKSKPYSINGFCIVHIYVYAPGTPVYPRHPWVSDTCTTMHTRVHHMLYHAGASLHGRGEGEPDADRNRPSEASRGTHAVTIHTDTSPTPHVHAHASTGFMLSQNYGGPWSRSFFTAVGMVTCLHTTYTHPPSGETEE